MEAVAEPTLLLLLLDLPPANLAASPPPDKEPFIFWTVVPGKGRPDIRSSSPPIPAEMIKPNSSLPWELCSTFLLATPLLGAEEFVWTVEAAFVAAAAAAVAAAFSDAAAAVSSEFVAGRLLLLFVEPVVPAASNSALKSSTFVVVPSTFGSEAPGWNVVS